MISIFIIDDHFLIGAGLREEFDGSDDGIEVAGYAANPVKAVELIGQMHVSIIVLDLFIGFLDPVANIRLLRSRYPQTPIVILSNEESVEWQSRMFAEGARAYLLKSEDREAMKDTLKQVAAGKIVIPETVARHNIRNLRNIPNPLLLPEEKEILTQLSTGHTIKDIAQKRERTSSAIEKVLKRVRERYNFQTTYELMAFFARSANRET